MTPRDDIARRVAAALRVEADEIEALANDRTAK